MTAAMSILLSALLLSQESESAEAKKPIARIHVICNAMSDSDPAICDKVKSWVHREIRSFSDLRVEHAAFANYRIDITVIEVRDLCAYRIVLSKRFMLSTDYLSSGFDIAEDAAEQLSRFILKKEVWDGVDGDFGHAESDKLRSACEDAVTRIDTKHFEPKRERQRLKDLMKEFESPGGIKRPEGDD